MGYNTIQYNTIQYNTIQYNTIQYNTRAESIFIVYLGHCICSKGWEYTALCSIFCFIANVCSNIFSFCNFLSARSPSGWAETESHIYVSIFLSVYVCMYVCVSAVISSSSSSPSSVEEGSSQTCVACVGISP